MAATRSRRGFRARAALALVCGLMIAALPATALPAAASPGTVVAQAAATSPGLAEPSEPVPSPVDPAEPAPSAPAGAAESSGPVLQDEVADGGADVLVVLATDPAAPAALEQLKDDALDVDGVEIVEDFSHLPVTLVHVPDADALAELLAREDVAGVTLPQRRELLASANLELIRQPAAITEPGFTGAGVTVAVLDSGVRLTGPGAAATFGDCSQGPGKLTCRITRALDCASTGSSPNQLSTPCKTTTSCQPDPTKPLDIDLDRHGSNVAGVVALTAPKVKIDSYRVFSPDYFPGSTGCTPVSNPGAWDEDILRALNAVASTAKTRNTRAVNLSLGGGGPFTSSCGALEPAYRAAFAQLRAVGVVPVVAAGNGGGLGVTAPACVPGALAVGAVYPASGPKVTWYLPSGNCSEFPAADKIPCFSQGGKLVGVLAPGHQITAAGVTMSGTSQATPHVTAAIGMTASARPTLNATGLTALVTRTGPKITDPRSGLQHRRLDLPSLVHGFADVSTDSPTWPQIEWAHATGVSTGWADGTFRPAAAIERQAVAALLYRLENPGVTPTACTTAPFTDVTANHPFCPQIKWMKDTGLSTGYTDGTFRPAAPIARDATAVFLARLWELPVEDCTDAPFVDVPVTHQFCPQISAFRTAGYSLGWPDGTFRPALNVERQAFVTYLYRHANPASP